MKKLKFLGLFSSLINKKSPKILHEISPIFSKEVLILENKVNELIEAAKWDSLALLMKNGYTLSLTQSSKLAEEIVKNNLLTFEKYKRIEDEQFQKVDSLIKDGFVLPEKIMMSLISDSTILIYSSVYLRELKPLTEKDYIGEYNCLHLYNSIINFVRNNKDKIYNNFIDHINQKYCMYSKSKYETFLKNLLIKEEDKEKVVEFKELIKKAIIKLENEKLDSITNDLNYILTDLDIVLKEIEEKEVYNILDINKKIANTRKINKLLYNDIFNSLDEFLLNNKIPAHLNAIIEEITKNYNFLLKNHKDLTEDEILNIKQTYNKQIPNILNILNDTINLEDNKKTQQAEKLTQEILIEINSNFIQKIENIKNTKISNLKLIHQHTKLGI